MISARIISFSVAHVDVIVSSGCLKISAQVYTDMEPIYLWDTFERGVI